MPKLSFQQHPIEDSRMSNGAKQETNESGGAHLDENRRGRKTEDYLAGPIRHPNLFLAFFWLFSSEPFSICWVHEAQTTQLPTLPPMEAAWKPLEGDLSGRLPGWRVAMAMQLVSSRLTCKSLTGELPAKDWGHLPKQ